MIKWAGEVARMRDIRMHTELCLESLKRMDHLEDLGVDGRRNKNAS
jgi:hypothetical protein